MEWPRRTDANKLVPGQLWPLAALFPLEAPSEVQAVLRVLPLDTARKLANGEILRPADFFSKEAWLITWRGFLLALPYRVYFQEPLPELLEHFSTRQLQLLHCLYLRHYDGYVRQRHLETLLALGAGAPEAFTPFTFSLLGEYVQEILEVLAVGRLLPARAPGGAPFFAVRGCPVVSPLAKSPLLG